MEMEAIIQKVWELTTIYGIKVILALLILFFGRLIAKLITKIVGRIMDRSKIDPTIIKFVGNLIYIGLIAFVIIAALGQLGIQTASFVAVIAAAGLAIGLALQGSLANFAAGFLMIIFRPFTVGDFIEGAGTAGTVEEISIFTTVLKTPDNKTVIVPNAKISEDNIVNWTTKGTRRVDLVMGIGYDDDIDKAKQVMADVIAKEDRILKNPAPLIALLELADSSVNFVVRPWVNSGDYWDVHFALTENMKKAFDANGISIPFPQRDVHIYEHKEG
jgi:small conductance mechanosensitive channel